MEQNEQKIASLEAKIDAMSTQLNVATTIVRRLYIIFIVTGVVTVLAFVIPLIGLAFVIPQFLAGYSAVLGI
jgi:phage shock protein PspC (stress-responsive transcriptional regulator)